MTGNPAKEASVIEGHKFLIRKLFARNQHIKECQNHGCETCQRVWAETNQAKADYQRLTKEWLG